jgi:hypothetical protein
MQTNRRLQCINSNKASSIFDAFSRWHILPSTRTTHTNLGRVEFRGSGTVGETLSTGVDSLVTELLPVLSVLSHYLQLDELTQFGEAGCTWPFARIDKELRS